MKAWYAAVLVIHAHAYSSEDCADAAQAYQQALNSCCALLCQLEASNKSIQDLLAHITSELSNANVMINTVISETADDPEWVIFARATSATVTITKQDSDYVARPKDDLYAPPMKLIPGDHNLWFDTHGTLWGYTKHNALFYRNPS